jgi:hypothetical protein
VDGATGYTADVLKFCFPSVLSECHAPLENRRTEVFDDHASGVITFESMNGSTRYLFLFGWYFSHQQSRAF